MIYPIICPDGADRLKARWDKYEDAVFDAQYFSRRTSCWDWCDNDESDKDRCPGGAHTVGLPPAEEEAPLAWAVSL